MRAVSSNVLWRSILTISTQRLARRRRIFRPLVNYSVDDRTERLHSIEAQLNRVLSQSPNNAWAHVLMGRILNQTNRQAQAIEEFNRALTLNPNLAAAHALIGLAKLYDGHPEETERHVLEALRVSPRDTDAYFWVGWMGHAKLYLGAYEDALNSVSPLDRTEPELSHGHFTYCAATLVELGRLDEAKSRNQSRACRSILISPSGAIGTPPKATIRFT